VLLEIETDFKADTVASLDGVVFAACPEEASFNEIVFLGPEEEEDPEEEEEEPELCQLDVSPCFLVPPDLVRIDTILPPACVNHRYFIPRFSSIFRLKLCFYCGCLCRG